MENKSIPGVKKNLKEYLEDIYSVLDRHEKRLKESNFKEYFSKFFRRKLNFITKSNLYRDIHLALCIDTRDPLKQNRVKYFSPILHIPLRYSAGPDGKSDVTKISQLDWAYPVASMGGFDDCGATWVPPPGSMLALLFLHGDPNLAFYIGTTWYRDKGPIMHDNWNYHIQEYYKIFEGHRAGYMVGDNDESQVFPSWNTDNYQGYNIDSGDVEKVPDAVTKTTFPHIYGQTTPEKHRIKMDDGDPKCNRRFKRFEIISSMGHLFLMKDDPYNGCGSWLNPKCFVSYYDVIPSVCPVTQTIYIDAEANDISFITIKGSVPCEQGADEKDCPRVAETPDLTVQQEYKGKEGFCSRTPFPSVSLPEIPESCLNGIMSDLHDICFTFDVKGKNKYHGHRQECFPYLAKDCGLPQSGMMTRSRSGHLFVMDDSVEEPNEIMGWEATLSPFDKNGCTGNYRGRTYWKSSSGCYIELNDTETDQQRSSKSGVHIVSGTGNRIDLNDDTLCCCTAGPKRGVHIQSSSNMTIDLCDDGNQQCATRDGCAKPGAYAKKAFMRFRSGYGLTFTMCDFSDQTKTDAQYIQIFAPQKDNLVRGPHVLHMQERKQGPGQIFLRAGGDYIITSYDKMVEVVGDEKDNPSDKIELISRHKLVSAREVYYNRAGTHVFYANDYIFLLAGQDAGENTPQMYPVVVAYQQIPDYVSAVTGLKASEHVFASALKEPEPCEGIASE
jgi:hypothetical protein